MLFHFNFFFVKRSVNNPIRYAYDTSSFFVISVADRNFNLDLQLQLRFATSTYYLLGKGDLPFYRYKRSGKKIGTST